MSKRLQACLNYTRKFNNLADIGTDHALLPIEAVKEGYVYKAQAIDNKYGPFLRATKNVKAYDLKDKIKVKLGDGLEKIEADTDVAVVSGLGGSTMRDILLAKANLSLKRIILNANNNPYQVRAILSQIDYHIIDELVIKEAGKYYFLIVLEPSFTPLTKQEVLFGPVNLKEKTHFFKEYYKKELKNYESILTQIEQAKDKKPIQQQITEIKEVLS